MAAGKNKKQISTKSPARGKPGRSHERPSKLEKLQRTLIKTIIALPLLDKINARQASPPRGRSRDGESFDVIIDAHLDFPAGRKEARKWIRETLAKLLDVEVTHPELRYAKNEDQPQYVFATLNTATIKRLVVCDGLSAEQLKRGDPKLGLPPELPQKPIPESWDTTQGVPRAIYQIWEDFEVAPLISKSISTVKADAARAAFRAAGKEIVWAVVDSGVNGDHVQFRRHRNLQGIVSGWHRDFTQDAPSEDGENALSALRDDYGHGTHVAGIIAGEVPLANNAAENPDICAYQRILEADGVSGERQIQPRPLVLESTSGMAPQTGIVSLKVLDARGKGHVSNIIAALTWIQEINGYGRRIRIHGVNLSVGYPFDAEWFACGQSQLCVEVDRLVRSGVVVVVAAGNTGYGVQATEAQGPRKGGLPLSINDPGNAELAITVGSTHRDMPHVYGVSYFSGKGPTGDGRMKPDVLAPGEKIVSCGAGKLLSDVREKLPEDARVPNYIEYTGTSMAAPHVSGCVAAFLSVKREFIGRPEKVKAVFMSTATDLGRDRTFQGAGLVDLMRAIQHV